LKTFYKPDPVVTVN